MHAHARRAHAYARCTHAYMCTDDEIHRRRQEGKPSTYVVTEGVGRRRCTHPTLSDIARVLHSATPAAYACVHACMYVHDMRVCTRPCRSARWWSVVSGQWSVVSGQWSVGSGQWAVIISHTCRVAGQGGAGRTSRGGRRRGAEEGRPRGSSVRRGGRGREDGQGLGGLGESRASSTVG